MGKNLHAWKSPAEAAVGSDRLIKDDMRPGESADGPVSP
jgi:hypothetical protein